MPSTETTAGTELSGVQERRELYKVTIDQVERALAHPLAGRPGEWVAEIAPYLDRLATVFDHHVSSTEAPDGLLAVVVDQAPRLAPQVERMRAEHTDLTAELLGVLGDLAAAETEPEVERLRERATALLGRLVRHRQRGADLIYEAYHVDLAEL